jgi:dTDP-4-amino-4,6-dideoxygalactose transaminase
MTVFSFHPVKAIASGEGGMVTTNDEPTYRHLLRLRSHGINKLDDSFQLPEQACTNGVQNPWYYEMQELGYNYRITDIQCALGLSQSTKLDMFLARRRALVTTYDAAFSGSCYCRPAQSIGRDSSSHHIYVLRIDFAAVAKSRGEIMRQLHALGIVTQVHYIPVPTHPHFRRLGVAPEDYPNAQNYYRDALTIPLFFDLTEADQQLVIASIRELVG